jgi:hypothetical protein
MAGRPKCFPRVWAALIPAVTRSLMSDDPKFRHCADDGEHRLSHGAVGVNLILDADEACAEMIEFLQGCQQVACAAREAIEFSH